MCLELFCFFSRFANVFLAMLSSSTCYRGECQVSRSDYQETSHWTLRGSHSGSTVDNNPPSTEGAKRGGYNYNIKRSISKFMISINKKKTAKSLQMYLYTWRPWFHSLPCHNSIVRIFFFFTEEINDLGRFCFVKRRLNIQCLFYNREIRITVRWLEQSCVG